MSQTINSREVLLYLNELGYQNITREKLKEFMINLKKLIKYEDKKNSENVENIPRANLFNQPHHYLPTKASLARQNEQKEKKVILEMRRPFHDRHACTNKNSCFCEESTYRSSTTYQNGSSRLLSKSDVSSAPDLLNVEDNVLHVPERSKSCDTITKPKRKNPRTRPKTYILPRPPLKISKCDPVMLYHQYKEGWKKLNVPGEADHAELRWSIRERLIGQPQVASRASSVETISKKRPGSTNL